MTRRIVSLAIVLAVSIMVVTPNANGSAPQPGMSSGIEVHQDTFVTLGTEETLAAEDAFKSSPVMFIENVGQWDDGARFQVWGGPAGTMWLAEDAIWVTVLEPKQNAAGGYRDAEEDARLRLLPDNREDSTPRRGVNIKLSFVGANSKPRIENYDRLGTKVSYFLGNDPAEWRPDVPVWGGVRYVNLYPGVDLEITSEAGQMVPRLTARPGANLDAVLLAVEGADTVAMDGDVLRLSTAAVDLSLPLLRADGLQVAPRPETERSGGAKVEQSGAQAFEVAAPFVPVDSYRQSAIDYRKSPADNPADLFYGTFLGGSGGEAGYAIAVDEVGSAYMVGYTGSSDFPTTPGAFDPIQNGNADVFVAKLNPTGSGLAYATFLGGSNRDEGYGLAVDAAGSAYVTGTTYSGDFPTTWGAFDPSQNGGWDVFVARLTPTGSGLAYGTFVGGSSSDYGRAIAVDGLGSAYVTGETFSSNFPATPGAFDPIFNGGDAFVIKLNPAGGGLAYGTFLGDNFNDYGYAIAVDGVGNSFVTGETYSSNFPTTPGAFDRSLNGLTDTFLAKLNPAGSGLAYATFLGGSNQDGGYGMAVDEAGNAYVTGYTLSGDFPTTPGAFDLSLNGGTDGYVVKLNPAGSTLAYATFLGGNEYDFSYGIAANEAGSAFVTGYTYSGNFPTTLGAFDPSFNGGTDGYVVKLNPDGSALAYATFLGDSGSDTGVAIAVDWTGSAYVTGYTASSSFPVTPGTFDPTYNGSGDAYMVELAMGVTGTPIILVHGWMGNPRNAPSKWRSCETGLQTFSISNPQHEDWREVARALSDAGHAVYVANLDSSPLHTPSIETNAACLKRQVDSVASRNNPAILIAHSMGGLVSRAYIENEDLYQEENVSHVITLGTPHGGVNWSALRLLLLGNAVYNWEFCVAQPAVCQFSTDGVLVANARYHDRARDSEYTLIGGVSSSNLARIVSIFEGPNDTFVGRNSARGYYWPIGTAVDNDNGRVGRYQTVSEHGGYFSDANTIECIGSRLGLGGSCDLLAVEADFSAMTEPPLTSQTSDVTGIVSSGQSVSRTIAVDTDAASMFMLTWMEGALSFTLTDPSGLDITPSYAVTHPTEVSYSSGTATYETPPWASYAFTNTVPGVWTLTIEATSTPPVGTSYMASVYMETDLQLAAGTDQTLYQIGDTTTFTASLNSTSGGIAGAAVEAIIARSDGVTDTMSLVDQGNGNYQSTYVIPDAPGFMFASVVATGSHDGASFSRQVDFALSVASPFVSLNGQYSARTPDENGDGNFDALLLDVGVTATQLTTITLSGDLTSASVTRTLTAITTTVVTPGAHVLILGFPGRSIHRFGGDGPYTLTNVILEDIGVGGVLADTASNALVTAAYDHRQFGLRGDVDDSCIVDVEDLIHIASAWNTSGFDPILDMNRDGVITVADVMLAAGNWGAAC